MQDIDVISSKLLWDKWLFWNVRLQLTIYKNTSRFLKQDNLWIVYNIWLGEIAHIREAYAGSGLR